jgi:hypothetical protein
MQRAVFLSFLSNFLYTFAYIRISLILIYYANAGVRCNSLYLFSSVTHCEKSINDSSRAFDSAGYRRIRAR